MSIVPSPLTPGRSLSLFVAAAALFAAALVANIVGGAFFPSAPVEQIYNFLISVDLVAGIVVCLAGIVVVRVRAVAASPRPLLAFSGLSVAGVVFVAIAFGGWIALSGIGILLRIPTGERGRYMYDVAGIVYFGIPWIVGIAFSMFGFRRNGTRLNTILCTVGLAVGLALLVSPAISAVLYGLGLTD